jgi:hypothetical protein
LDLGREIPSLRRLLMLPTSEFFAMISIPIAFAQPCRARLSTISTERRTTCGADRPCPLWGLAVCCPLPCCTSPCPLQSAQRPLRRATSHHGQPQAMVHAS